MDIKNQRRSSFCSLRDALNNNILYHIFKKYQKFICWVFIQSCKHLYWYTKHQCILCCKLLKAIYYIFNCHCARLSLQDLCPEVHQGDVWVDVPLPTPTTGHLPAALLHLMQLRLLATSCELQREAQDTKKATGHRRWFPSPCSPTLALKCDPITHLFSVS